MTNSCATVRTAIPNGAVNGLLASLPSDAYRRVAPHLTTMPTKHQQVVLSQGAPIEFVYFPTGGAWSLIKAMRDGHVAEVATMGAEGAFGCSAFFGESHAECDLMVQLPGPPAWLMPIDTFMAEMNRHEAFFNTMIRYNQALTNQIMQTTACNSLHSAEQRCCRWLLMMHDRSSSVELVLTQELLSMMLGVRRPTVTLILSSLQRAGVVEVRRGAVRILDRARLERTSCECYETVREHMQRLMPTIPDRRI